ncbi:hypothetical protein MMC10_007048 [Thelotrema lepadinum]|nr:hypothetical protein [Thelotrema lepadinum]
MPPPLPAYNIDWVLSNSSNVHLATDRDWFKSYYPFHSTVKTIKGTSIPVLGVGTVDLPLKEHVKKAGSNTINLRHVLHVPSSPCNIVSSSELSVCYRLDGDSLTPKIGSQRGRQLGFVECPKLPRLRLKGQGPAHTSLDKDQDYVVGIVWVAKERKRWKASKEGGLEREAWKDGFYTAEEWEWFEKYGGERHFFWDFELGSVDNMKDRFLGREIAREMMLGDKRVDAFYEEDEDDDEDGDEDGDEDDDEKPFYSAGEIRYLRNGYDGELVFMQLKGLNIRKLEDRMEGRRIVRWEMDQYGIDEDFDCYPPSGSDTSEEPDLVLAKPYFSKAQLVWIRKKYEYMFRFMDSHNLKPYLKEDCVKGRAIVQERMKEEGFEDEDGGDREGKGEDNSKDNGEEESESGSEDEGPFYSTREEEYLEKNYGGELKFLQLLQLDIDKRKDRVKVRRAVHAMMSYVSSEHDEEEYREWLEEPKGKWAAHFADKHFTASQLVWMKLEYDESSFEFLMSYKLSPFKDEDCVKGEEILQEHIKTDEETRELDDLYGKDWDDDVCL